MKVPGRKNIVTNEMARISLLSLNATLDALRLFALSRCDIMPAHYETLFQHPEHLKLADSQLELEPQPFVQDIHFEF